MMLCELLSKFPQPERTLLLGTNLIHDFTAVIFSVKLAVFHEMPISVKSVILALLLSFMKVFRVLSFNSFCADLAVC